jgi:hypothetical protein
MRGLRVVYLVVNADAAHRLRQTGLDISWCAEDLKRFTTPGDPEEGTYSLVSLDRAPISDTLSDDGDRVATMAAVAPPLVGVNRPEPRAPAVPFVPRAIRARTAAGTASMSKLTSTASGTTPNVELATPKAPTPVLRRV